MKIMKKFLLFFPLLVLASCGQSASSQAENSSDMKTYVVVDLQKDFYHPEGRLSVGGADVMPGRVAAAIKDCDAVIFTLDWHPYAHCSFAAQGGPWPAHCVQYTDGASLPFEVIQAAQGKRILYYFKGQDPAREEYGAFADITPEQKAVLDSSSEIVVCGLCGDYCVGQTIRRLVELGYGPRIVVDMACTGSIDDGSSLAATIEEFNLRTR